MRTSLYRRRTLPLRIAGPETKYQSPTTGKRPCDSSSPWGARISRPADNHKRALPPRDRELSRRPYRLPDLDQAKSAVLNSLSSEDAERGHRHAMDEFIEWYCSEQRLSFSRTVVVRY